MIDDRVWVNLKFVALHIMSVSQGMRFRWINLMYCTTVISRELLGAGSLLNESCKEYFCKVTGQKKWFRKLPTQKKIHDENSCTFLADSSEGKRAKQKQCVLCCCTQLTADCGLCRKENNPESYSNFQRFYTYCALWRYDNSISIENGILFFQEDRCYRHWHIL